MNNKGQNSPKQDLNLKEIFDINIQNTVICGDFQSHQELNCTYNTKNGEKLLQIIDDGTPFTEQRLSSLSIN